MGSSVSPSTDKGGEVFSISRSCRSFCLSASSKRQGTHPGKGSETAGYSEASSPAALMRFYKVMGSGLVFFVSLFWDNV